MYSFIDQPVDLQKAVLQPLYYSALQHTVPVDVLRIDAIHPIISGNKWFKLKYHLSDTIAAGKQGLLTFGGAWSNHLVATAAAARQAGLRATGIVRGEAAAVLSPTLLQAQELGMQLQFVARSEYADEKKMIERYAALYPELAVVPQGGQSPTGVRGASEITALAPLSGYTHLACAAGTGTMMAGLVLSSLPHQQVLGFSSLKLPDSVHNSITRFVQESTQRTNFTLFTDYHFGGFARKTDRLLSFMNDLYRQSQLPTDLVYTGKLFYGLLDLLNKNYFSTNSRLLVIHSGGLQGNRSLPPGSLLF